MLDEPTGARARRRFRREAERNALICLIYLILGNWLHHNHGYPKPYLVFKEER